MASSPTPPAGVAGSLALARVLESLFYQVSPSDPAAIVLIAVFLAAVATLATLLPALAAARVDPVETLRYDG